MEIYMYRYIYMCTHTQKKMVYSILFFKKKEILRFTTQQVNLENSMLSETDTERQLQADLSCMWNLKKV